MNQKAGLSVSTRDRPGKTSFDGGIKSPGTGGRARSSTHGSQDGSQNGTMTLNTVGA
jgi:hypothetical protein